MWSQQQFDLWYNGTPEEKLSQAQFLLPHFQQALATDNKLAMALETLRDACAALAAQMASMNLGPLCSRCAARPGGGCCSALMADNTDSLQILINLLLGISVSLRTPADAECCFLGPTGCPFPAKPIFCLNYNCTHIREYVAPQALGQLERCAAEALSQQTTLESLFLDRLRRLTF